MCADPTLFSLPMPCISVYANSALTVSSIPDPGSGRSSAASHPKNPYFREILRQGYTCVTATPCLADGGGCTQRCVPLAATFCADLCPNALDAAPPSGAAAGTNGGTPNPNPGSPATAANLSGLSGNALALALGAEPGSSAGRMGASKWLRGVEAERPIEAATKRVWTLPPIAG